MNRIEIAEEIKQILVAVLKHSDFEMRDDLTAADVYGWDSLSHMLILTEIEEKFKFKFKLKEINRLKNMATLIDVIESKL